MRDQWEESPRSARHMVDLGRRDAHAARLRFSECANTAVEDGDVCKIAGSVSTEHETTSPMPVGLVRHSGGALDERQNWSLADHFVLESSGRWLFRVGPGTYGLVAFEDVKRGRRVSTHRTGPPLDNDSRGRQSGGAERGKIKRFLQAAGKDEPAKKL